MTIPLVNDTWILERRGAKAILDPARAYGTEWEREVDASGALVPTAVVFLTNRECPFRCVMCDLWVNTLDTVVPAGAITAQIRTALAELPPPAGPAGASRHIKLYNAGSFFDPQAIPPSEDEQIARLLDGFDRVVVEAHPAFLMGAHGRRCVRFRDLLAGRLEVAIGLETAEADVLARLNKRMTLDAFGRAAEFLASHDIDLRAFILLAPPFLGDRDPVEAACHAVDFAADHGAAVCSIIPTRDGNGAMEALGEAFSRPKLVDLEAAVERSLASRRLRVFADLWNVERLFTCACSPARAERLRRMNETQRIPERMTCHCDARL